MSPPWRAFVGDGGHSQGQDSGIADGLAVAADAFFQVVNGFLVETEGLCRVGLRAEQPFAPTCEGFGVQVGVHNRTECD